MSDANVPGVCSACSSPRLREINAALEAGESVCAVGRRFGISKSAISRHRQRCMPLAVAVAEASRKREELAREVPPFAPALDPFGGFTPFTPPAASVAEPAPAAEKLDDPFRPPVADPLAGEKPEVPESPPEQSMPSAVSPRPAVRRRTGGQLAEELDDLSRLLCEALGDRSLATGGLSLLILRELPAVLELTVKTQLSLEARGYGGEPPPPLVVEIVRPPPRQIDAPKEPAAPAEAMKEGLPELLRPDASVAPAESAPASTEQEPERGLDVHRLPQGPHQLPREEPDLVVGADGGIVGGKQTRRQTEAEYLADECHWRPF